MPSFNQIVAAHAPLLVIDAASARIQVGWLAADGSVEGGIERGRLIFEGVRGVTHD